MPRSAPGATIGELMTATGWLERKALVGEGRQITAADPRRDEIIETITHLAFYAGWPPAMTALQIARKVFEETSK